MALAALLAYRVGGRAVMIVTSLLGIFHFGHMVQAAAPNSEPLYGLLLVLVLIGAMRPATHAWLLGALAAMTTLVRAEFALCAALLAVWLAFDHDRRQAASARRRSFALAFAARAGADDDPQLAQHRRVQSHAREPHARAAATIRAGHELRRLQLRQRQS